MTMQIEPVDIIELQKILAEEDAEAYKVLVESRAVLLQEVMEKCNNRTIRLSGFGKSLDPVALTNRRMEHLIDWTMPQPGVIRFPYPDPLNRIEFELQWAVIVLEALEQGIRQAMVATDNGVLQFPKGFNPGNLRQ